jgi:hypothetical protein
VPSLAPLLPASIQLLFRSLAVKPCSERARPALLALPELILDAKAPRPKYAAPLGSPTASRHKGPSQDCPSRLRDGNRPIDLLNSQFPHAPLHGGACSLASRWASRHPWPPHERLAHHQFTAHNGPCRPLPFSLHAGRDALSPCQQWALSGRKRGCPGSARQAGSLPLPHRPDSPLR